MMSWGGERWWSRRTRWALEKLASTDGGQLGYRIVSLVREMMF